LAGEVIPTRFQAGRGIATALRNVFDLVLLAGCRHWLRSFSASFAALGSIALLALMAGVAGLAALALFNLSTAQATQASVLHVYLLDEAPQDQINDLQSRLGQDPRVTSVTYVSKSDALQRAEKRPGMTQLVSAADTNPFPASLDVGVRSLGEIRAVAALVAHDPAADPQHPSSFDADFYARLQFAFRTVAIAGTGLLLLLLVVAAAVTAGSIRSTLLARREEVEVMWLVGSPRWMIGGPFLVEGALTGGIGTTVGGGLAFLLGVALVDAQAGSFSVFLPGVTVAAMATLLGILIGSGLGVGSLAALIGVRDLRP
jgi:cell division transport system permease protein